MKGRKPTPTAAKELAGNPGKRPINKREPRPRAAGLDCPAELTPTAAAEWLRVVPELVRLRLVGNIDRATLAAYCAAWATFSQAEQQLRDGASLVGIANGAPTVSAWLRVRSTAVRELRALAAELGLTPSARSRVAAPSTDWLDSLDDDEDDVRPAGEKPRLKTAEERDKDIRDILRDVERRTRRTKGTTR